MEEDRVNLPDRIQSPPVPLSLGSIMPDRTPDVVQLMQANASNDMDQAVLYPETVAETLLSLQKTVQKCFSHEGVRHLLGILRQIAENRSRNICEFDMGKHFRLVARITRKGECSGKQKKLFNQVFELLSNLRVVRFWNSTKGSRKITSPFIVQIGIEQNNSVHDFAIKKLLLDPLFFPSCENPYQLGSHLQLIPHRLFRESIHKHALLPGLSSYLSGSWLNDYLQKQGILEKTAREIIEGCAFNVTANNRYCILRKLGSELEYMERRKYIKECRFVKNPDGNPWEDLYRIRAPEETLKMVADFQRFAIPEVTEKQCG